MRTGIKRLAKKVIDQLQYPSLLYSQINKHVFPDKPVNPIHIEARLYSLHSELQQRNIFYNLGSLYTLPHPVATKAYKRFIDYNPGNLGTWSDNTSKIYATTKLEYEVIHKLIDIYHGDHDKLSGYITSGGTEGNIFTLWCGRMYLEQYYQTPKICLLKTSLTHYSIRKAGALCNIRQYFSPLNTDDWNIDIEGLESTVRALYIKGYRGFILPLTLGYTSTGTSDDIESATLETKKLEKELKDARFFIWIDAALNGLIAPFLDNNFQPFASPSIQAFIVDFHKFGLVPYSAGIVLYRKSLKKLITQPIDYLSETDSTLLGSRSGIPAVSIWAMIHTLGKKGYQGFVTEQQQNKKYFITQLKRMLPETEIITSPNSLSSGIIFHSLKDRKLPKQIEEKYWLYGGKTKLLFYPKNRQEKVMYKIFFLPHIKRKILEEFFSDLRKI